MDYTFRTLLLFLAAGFAHGVELTISTSSDVPMTSPINLPTGTPVRFRCSYGDVIPQDVQSSSTHVVKVTGTNLVKGEPVVPVATCFIISAENLQVNIGPSFTDANLPHNESSYCNSRQMSFLIDLNSSQPANYTCTVETATFTVLGTATTVTLRSHTLIPQDKINLISEPVSVVKEGEMIYFTCSCTAKPPPDLRFKINSENTDKSNYTLTPTGLTLDTPEGMSIAKLNLTATGSIKSVSCYPLNHPSGSTAQKSTDLIIHYGPPSDLSEETIKHNYQVDGKLQQLNATVDAFPMSDVTYSWHREEEAGDSPFANSAITSVPPGDIEQIEVGKTGTLEYWCKIVNKGNNNKEAKKKFTLIVSNETITTTGPDKNTEPDPDKDGDTDIGLIVGCVVGAVVLIVLIIVIVICVKRRQTRTPEKGKKAAAARADAQQDSQPYNSQSTNSLHKGERASLGYHDNPTLPVEYRNSQGNPEVYTGFDDKPRSRKPIALDELGADALDGGPPMYGEAPPAYTNTMTSYNSSRPTYPQHQDNYYNPNPPYSPSYGGSSYGAAC